MSIPTVHPFPVRRPGFIQTAEWVGPDAQLGFKVTYFDETGTLRSTTFATRNAGDSTKGEICLPSGLLANDLHELGVRYEDILRAHTRMACLVAGTAVPGSDEFSAAILNGQTQNLQTALGAVKVNAVTPIDDQTVRLTFKCGTGPNLDVEMNYSDLNSYAFVPDTQLFVIPGSVKKQFSTYVHDYPTTILSAQRRQEIVDYVLSLAPWV